MSSARCLFAAHRPQSPRNTKAPESFGALGTIAEEFGVSIETQVAGAPGTWLAFMDRERKRGFDKQPSWLTETVRQLACVLDPDSVDFELEGIRAKRVMMTARGSSCGCMKRRCDCHSGKRVRNSKRCAI